MAYESVTGIGQTNSYLAPRVARPEPQTPAALAELSEAAKAYANAAGAFIVARDGLNDARDRFNQARDLFAKHAESEGI